MKRSRLLPFDHLGEFELVAMWKNMYQEWHSVNITVTVCWIQDCDHRMKWKFDKIACGIYLSTLSVFAKEI